MKLVRAALWLWTAVTFAKSVTAVTADQRAARDIASTGAGWSRPSINRRANIMNVQETNEIRELASDELEAVSGGVFNFLVGVAASAVATFVMTPGKQSLKEWVSDHT
jgi:hypothetical protein